MRQIDEIYGQKLSDLQVTRLLLDETPRLSDRWLELNALKTQLQRETENLRLQGARDLQVYDLY